MNDQVIADDTKILAGMATLYIELCDMDIRYHVLRWQKAHMHWPAAMHEFKLKFNPPKRLLS